jgi:hypothetical protein
MIRSIPHVLRGVLLVLALLLPTFAAASATPAEKPRPGMAVLNSDNNGRTGRGVDVFIGMRIGVLDGDSLRSGMSIRGVPTTVHVAPGRHTVRLQYYGAGVGSSGHFWWDAAADRSYTARYRIQGERIDMWIEDDATGQRVGGVGDGEDEGLATSVAPAGVAGPGAKAPPPAPDATTAVLVGDPGTGPTGMMGTWDGKTLDRLEIAQLDGKRERHGSNEYQALRLAPGRHTVELWYRKSTMEIRETLEFTVEANRTYWVRRLTEDYRVRFWIEDAATGATVSRPVPKAKP